MLFQYFLKGKNAQYQYSQAPTKVYNRMGCYNVALLYEHSVRNPHCWSIRERR